MVHATNLLENVVFRAGIMAYQIKLLPARPTPHMVGVLATVLLVQLPGIGMYLGKQQRLAQVLESHHTYGGSRRSSWLWPSPKLAFVAIWGMEQ